MSNSEKYIVLEIKDKYTVYALDKNGIKNMVLVGASYEDVKAKLGDVNFIFGKLRSPDTERFTVEFITDEDK